MGSYSVDGCIRHLKGHPGWSPALWFCASGVWRASLSTFQLQMLAVGREAMGMAPPLHVTQQCCRASTAARLSSTGISHHDLLPHIPSIHLSTVNSSLRPGVAPQSLSSSSQLLHLPRDLRPCPEYIGLRQGLSILIPLKLLQLSCFTLSLKCFSSDSDNCPVAGIRPLLQSPHPRGQVQS